MMNLDFASMSKSELRTYVVAHPEDQQAFQAFVDRATAEAPAEVYDLPHSIDDFAALDVVMRSRIEREKAAKTDRQQEAS
jgi:alpha-D-ribose 1-methylphosphonate 5-triphosphate synthase subunit PhnI